MPAFEILKTSLPDPLPEAIRAAQIRRPAAGAVSDVFGIDVSGVVVPREGSASSVEIYCDGELLRLMPVGMRTGLQRAFPDLPDSLQCGFVGLVGALVLPLEFELELVAVLEGGSRVTFGTITGRRGRPHPSPEPKLRPLMLTSVGRTGTVLMMRMLAAHPGIVVQEHQPVTEAWPARYWAHMLKVLSAPADAAHSVTSHNFDHHFWLVGRNPFYGPIAPAHAGLLEWLGQAHVDRLASFCRQNIEDWYAIVARDQGKDPVYFAEKNLLRTRIQMLGVADLYPDTREVFLVRDFRDMACSWLAFRGDQWRERGGLDRDSTVRELLGPWTRFLVAAWRARGKDAHLVRYEDLVERPAEVLPAVFDHLGLDSSPDTIEQVAESGSDKQRFSSHGTAATVKKTVGRWETEGDEQFRRSLNETFRDALVEFGYTEG